MPNYTIYALTLPGFDGQPAIKPPLFDTVTADFWNLLAQKNIAKPIVIGHSLGGTMGFMLATQHPERLGGVVALDGLPIYPANIFSTPDQARSQADSMAATMAAQTHEQFVQSEKTQTLPFMITAQTDVAAVAPLVGRSDPVATAAWFKEDLLLDLRPQLVKANVPILLIAPYDAALEGKYAPNAAAKQQFYASIVKNAPHVEVVTIENSRHFAMYDQPRALNDAIDTYLKSSK